MYKSIIFSIFISICFKLAAGPGDTIRIKAIDFNMRGDVKEKWIVFPDSTHQYAKILMYYKLKCDPLNTPYKCGEWDYLTYTHASKKTGKYKEFPNFKVNDAVLDSFSYVKKQAWNYSPRIENSRIIESQVNVNNHFCGDSASKVNISLNHEHNTFRSQFVLTYNELVSAGVRKDDIQGISINVLNEIHFSRLIIRIRHTSDTVLSSYDIYNTGFTTVFDQSYSFTKTGWNQLFFNQPFLWDSASNLLIDFIFYPENSSADFIVEGNNHFTGKNLNCQTDNCLFFEGNDYIEVPLNNISKLNKTLSIAVWVKGNPDFMPQNTYIFEGVNASNKRVVSSHLPWANGSIYWDAGNDGSNYDRIEKAAQPSEYEGQWNFWTFTKDATKGEMNIYLNGKLWHSGSGKTKSMTGITKFIIGASAANTAHFDGWIDNFSIWDIVLTEEEITELMFHSPNASYNNYSHLLAFYNFNEGNGMNCTELVTGKTSKLSGVPQWYLFKPEEQFKDFNSDKYTPHLIVDQSKYLTNGVKKLVTDSVNADVFKLVLYSNFNKPDMATDTLYVWKNNPRPTFDSNGNIVALQPLKADSVIYLQYHQAIYDEKFAIMDKYEIGRFITPYGINLDLGEGFTWVYDVSDYAPVLRDSVKISSGNWQELHELQFVLVEGTPARNPIRVINLWNGNPAYNAAAENFLIPKKVFIKAEEKNVRLKFRTTGHGMGGNENCAEFCPKTHTIDINGVKRFDQLVWRDNCAANPLYPQGGTWIYQRANWCPGAEVYTHDFEITPYINSGDSVEIDYNFQPYTWNGQGSQPNYVVASQLITYDTFNFKNDAAILEIIRPNNWEYYLRENPSCLNPVIIIQNNGSENLTSLLIKYGSETNNLAAFEWHGNLAPFQTEEVELPFYWGSWNAGNQFKVSLSLPNGKADEYEFNNTKISTFSFPPVYSNELLFYLKTNNAPHETAYRLIDASGKIWFERKFNTLNANKLYIDTFLLPNTHNCYRLEIFDSGEDGLNFWANNDGSGTARLKAKDGVFYPQVNPDFGSYTAYNFTTGWNVNTNLNKTEPFVRIFPNPAREKVFLEVNIEKPVDASLLMYDVYGQLIFSEFYNQIQSDIIEIQLNKIPKGVYFLRIKTEVSDFNFKLLID